MRPAAWSLDPDGNVQFDVTISYPESVSGDAAASREALGRIGDWLLPSLPADLTEGQAEAIACYHRYGHYFGREVFLRNSYKKKDLIGRVLAAAISGDDFVADEVVVWSQRIFKRRLNHDVRKIDSFSEVYDWAYNLSIELTAAGWPLEIEAMADVRP